MKPSTLATLRPPPAQQAPISDSCKMPGIQDFIKPNVQNSIKTDVQKPNMSNSSVSKDDEVRY